MVTGLWLQDMVIVRYYEGQVQHKAECGLRRWEIPSPIFETSLQKRKKKLHGFESTNELY
jgi:hypothetical protein